jgi:hypothetical protein
MYVNVRVFSRRVSSYILKHECVINVSYKFVTNVCFISVSLTLYYCFCWRGGAWGVVFPWPALKYTFFYWYRGVLGCILEFIECFYVFFLLCVSSVGTCTKGCMGLVYLYHELCRRKQ